MGLFKKDRSGWRHGTATVVGEKEGHMFSGGSEYTGPNNQSDKLELSITLPGKEPYTVSERKMLPVGWVGMLKGRSLPVLVHPEKDDDIYIDWDAELKGAQSMDVSQLTQLLGNLDGKGPIRVTGNVQTIDASQVPGLQEQLAQAFGGGGAAAEDPLDQLKKLGELHSSGVLTDEEFAAQKQKILGS